VHALPAPLLHRAEQEWHLPDQGQRGRQTGVEELLPPGDFSRNTYDPAEREELTRRAEAAQLEENRPVIRDALGHLSGLGDMLRDISMTLLRILSSVRDLTVNAMNNLVRMALVPPMHYFLRLIERFCHVDGIDDIIRRLRYEREDQRE
jgi:hypothetical protein